MLCLPSWQADVGLAGVESRRFLLQGTGLAPLDTPRWHVCSMSCSASDLIVWEWCSLIGLHHCLGLTCQMPTLHFRAGRLVPVALSFVSLAFVLHLGENSPLSLVTDWA